LCQQELRTLKGYSNIVTCVAFSPDGALLASGNMDNTVDNTAPTHKLRGGLDGVNSWVALRREKAVGDRIAAEARGVGLDFAISARNGPTWTSCRRGIAVRDVSAER